MIDNVMIPKMSWEQYSRNLPLVTFTGLIGEDMTIYACLQQAIKKFDYVIVFGDNPTLEALSMLDKLLSADVDFSAHAWKWVELYNKFKSLKLKEDLYFPKRFEVHSQYRSVIL